LAKQKKSNKPIVVLEGQFYAWHSLAHVNRELAKALSKSAAFDFRIKPIDSPATIEDVPDKALLKKLEASKSTQPLITIRHYFPPNLSPAKNVVLMQPWEFLEAPAAWVEFANKHAIDLWAPSRFSRESYIRSGVDPANVCALPLGYDQSVFAKKSNGQINSAFRFLFVGGTIERKGTDVLLNAYTREFTRDDKVELVIKDFGTKHVYRHNNLGDQIKSNSGSSGPKITYIDEDLSPSALAELYRSCDCLVQPYRAEGFCIPVIEAMACGTPVIVTAGGPTDEFVGHEMGWHISAKRMPMGQIPGLETSGGQGWLLPSQDDLQSAMRAAYRDPERTRTYGANAADYVARCFDWDAVAVHYERRLVDLIDEATNVRPRPTLSLCMIARDEEKIIADCLSSARPFVDEIVLVDTGSVDKTKAVAQPYVDKLTDSKWVNDFSAARNESLRHATGDWIIWLDADDTLPVETGRAIRDAIDRAAPNIMAFIVPVRFPDGSPSGGTVVDHVKVFRNLPGLAFEGRIHEQILPSIRQLGGEIARIDAVVTHTNYDYTKAGQNKKRKRDKKLLELDLQERPDHPFVLFNMGMTDHYNGEHESALQWLERSIEVAQPEESHVRKAYSLRAGSLSQLGRNEEALQVTARALSLFPSDPELLFQHARLQDTLGDPHAAIETYKQVLESNPSNHFSSFDHAILGYKTYHNIAGLYAKIRDYGSARKFWLKAIDAAPGFLDSLVELFENAIEVGDENTAKGMIEHVQQHFLGRELWRNMAAKWLRNFESESACERFLASNDYGDQRPV
jgi:glycosyltransferase involved in cell wall biosynthesis/tetratricopeptide (TPR) repeat protein